MSRTTTPRARKVPTRFTVDNAEDVEEYLPSPSPKKPRVRNTGNATPSSSSSHKTTDMSTSALSFMQPTSFIITNRTSPNFILGLKEATVFYPADQYQEIFPASNVSTIDGVTYVQQVRDFTERVDYSTPYPYRDTEVIFDAENVWNSTILTAAKLRIAKPTPLSKFLRPLKDGNFDDKVMTIDGVTYLWSYHAEAKSYTMREKKKSKSEVICNLQLTLKRTLVGNNLGGATLTIYNYPNYVYLREAMISCAVIFLNDYEKYRVGNI